MRGYFGWKDWQHSSECRSQNHSQRLIQLESDVKHYKSLLRDIRECKECGVWVHKSKAHVVKTHSLIASKWAPGPHRSYYCAWCAPDYTEIKYTLDGKKEVTSCSTEVIDCAGS